MSCKEIKSLDDLKNISPTGDYRLACDIDCKNQRISRIIGDFKGSLDGAGHSIKNIVLFENKVYSDGQPISLFYTMRKAVVKNLNILNMSVEVPNSAYKPNIAILCTEASDSTFENVVVNVHSSFNGKIPLIYDSNNCKYSNIRLSDNMIISKFE